MVSQINPRLPALHLLAFFAALLAALLAGPAVADSDSSKLVRAYNHTGLALFEKLAAQKGNIFISPYSIGSAMAMAASGARGQTAREMAKVLDYPVPVTELGPLAEALGLRLTMRADDEDAAITTANALHLTQGGDSVLPAYRDMVHEKFGAEIFTGSDLATVNGWVDEKTNGKIREILTQLSRNSVCVLLNAVYFKAGWATAFNAKSTRPDDFHLSADETVQVDTMHATVVAARLKTDTFDAALLPYKGGKLAMVAVRSARPDFNLTFPLTETAVRKFLTGLFKAEPERLVLAMPKFSFEYGANLVPLFKAIGLELPFDDAKADFSGIVPVDKETDRIHISQIAHKAFIEVDEEGTEAAAGTAVEFSVRSVAPPSAEFRLDRPFVFMIVDRPTGAVLFMGRVSDPRKMD
ncbi:MAG: serpin family protein [Salaquimonas sp.]|nr:serpin family protein [Salaquimonas sp.]